MLLVNIDALHCIYSSWLGNFWNMRAQKNLKKNLNRDHSLNEGVWITTVLFFHCFLLFFFLKEQYIWGWDITQCLLVRHGVKTLMNATIFRCGGGTCRFKRKTAITNGSQLDISDWIQCNNESENYRDIPLWLAVIVRTVHKEIANLLELAAKFLPYV